MAILKAFIQRMLQKHSFVFILVGSIFLLSGFTIVKNRDKFFSVPKQSLNLFDELGNINVDFENRIDGFQISEQVTYKEYKEYLNSVKKDSSEIFYLSQLPDVNISAPDIRSKYLSGSEYDNFPVLGISWNSAMNFCKWKTLQENQGKIQFIYRLPLLSEWLTAFQYLQNKSINHDFHKNYSDWLLNSQKHELFFKPPSNENPFPLDYCYFNKKNDHILKTHKMAIGNSYLFKHSKFIHFTNHTYYAQEGYRHISFRLVKVPIIPIETKDERSQLTSKILEYWEVK